VPNASGYRVFNLGSGSGYSVMEVIDSVEEVTGKKLRREMLPRRAGDPARLVASFAKGQRDLDWTPQFPDLCEILESAWKWYLSHPNGYEHLPGRD